jgi:hypothetical protein
VYTIVESAIFASKAKELLSEESRELLQFKKAVDDER